MSRHLMIGLFCIASAVAYGQTALATITGTVTDATGPLSQKSLWRCVTLRRGSPSLLPPAPRETIPVAQLPVGEYNLTVTAPGFKVYSHAGFRLAAQQTMREDVTLTLGSTSESVTVTGRIIAAQNGIQRNRAQRHHRSVKRPPGAAHRFDRRWIPRSVCAGAHATWHLLPGWHHDGDQRQPQWHSAIPSGRHDDGQHRRESKPDAVHPGQFDAVQEVAVQTSNYAAEYGAAGGGVFNMVMKSGTNALHGGAYDYAVNEVLNAATPYTGLKNTQRRHDYGFTIGGPVVIPKLYNGRNKTFFFWSWEQYRERTLVTSTSPTVPTDAYRSETSAPCFQSKIAPCGPTERTTSTLSDAPFSVA